MIRLVDPKDQFLPIEAVRVEAYCSLGTPYTIRVYTSIDGGSTWSLVKDITSNTKSYSGDHTDISDAPAGRLYKLSLLYTSTQYAVRTLFIVPEVPLGAATALVACLAGLGYKRLRLHRRKL